MINNVINRKNISLSILNIDNVPQFLRKYKEVIDRLNEKSNLNKKNQLYSKITNSIHFDVMDNVFVPNIGVDIKYIQTAKNLGLYIDTHLMVANPIGEKYIQRAIEYGTDELTIHYEIDNFESILKYLNDKKKELLKKENRELKIGIAIKPNTKVEEIVKYKDKFSKLLIMTVEPGFGGQKYMVEINNKISVAKKLLKNHVIQIDGGVNFNTIREPLLSGVDSFVVGSYITKDRIENLYNNLLKFNVLAMIEELPKDSNVDFDKKLLQIVKDGYGEGDILIGITVPNTRKLANSIYKELDVNILQDFITSKYHEYRRFACFCLSNMIKRINDTSKDIYLMKDIIFFLRKNILYINNWDLTDEVGPNVVGVYLINLSDKEAKKELDKFYISSNNLWIKRIGIVSCLLYARKGYKEIPFYVFEKTIYDDEPLINKAVGWVLRELYKKYPKEILKYLKEKNKTKKLPRFVLSYACEKMTIKEKEEVLYRKIKNN